MIQPPFKPVPPPVRRGSKFALLYAKDGSFAGAWSGSPDQTPEASMPPGGTVKTVSAINQKDPKTSV